MNSRPLDSRKSEKFLCNGLGNLDRAKMLQAKVLSNDEDLLPVLVWTEDIGTLSDDEHAKIGIE